jgi:hypothetical protein
MAARVLSYFAGAHADRKIGCYDPGHCEWDEEAAAELLREWGWEAREAELREQSRCWWNATGPRSLPWPRS